MGDASFATMPRSTYRGVGISYEQFSDLMIVALTRPGADGSDRAPWDLQNTAERAGFLYDQEWIGRFADSMESFFRDVIATDVAPGKGLSAYPNSAAYELEPHLISRYFNSEDDVQNIFNPEYDVDPFEDIGQVYVVFLGRQLTIGCMEGEEEKTRKVVEQIEIASGETLKAIAGPLDSFRALLMGSVLIAEQLDETTESVPASDRIVRLNDNRTVELDHSSHQYKEAVANLQAAIDAIQTLNAPVSYDKEQVVEELRLGKRLLQSTKVRIVAGALLLLTPLYTAYQDAAAEALKPVVKSAIDSLRALFGI